MDMWFTYWENCRHFFIRSHRQNKQWTNILNQRLWKERKTSLWGIQNVIKISVNVLKQNGKIHSCHNMNEKTHMLSKMLKKQISSGQTPKRNNINPMNYGVLNIAGVGTNHSKDRAAIGYRAPTQSIMQSCVVTTWLREVAIKNKNVVIKKNEVAMKKSNFREWW